MIKAGYKKSSIKGLKAGYLGDSPSEMPTTVSFDSKELPALTKWKVGQKYSLELEVEMSSLSKDTLDNDGDMRGSFKVLSVAEDTSTEDAREGAKAK